MKAHIGTSGWYYEHWNEAFYPKDLKQKDRLKYYSNHFQTVEINSTFYHLPKESVVKNWHLQVPKKFIFSVKASQYITHRKRLLNDEESVQLFYKRAEFLEDNLGPILFQLPPSFKEDKERLRHFLTQLSKHHRHTFEFRHASWYCQEIYDLLHKHKIALCITDLSGKLSPLEITSNFTYLRLHGPKKAYRGSYSSQTLKKWKERIQEWNKQKIEVFCYFDNDEKGFAAQDAKRLIGLCT